MKNKEDIIITKEVPKNLEEIFLICCLKNNEYLELIRLELKKNFFQDKDYQIIFDKILSLYDNKILSFEALILSLKTENFSKSTIKKRILNKVLELNKDIIINKNLLQFYLNNYIKNYRFGLIERKFQNFLSLVNTSNYEDELLKLLSDIEQDSKTFKSEKFVKISKVISKLVESFKNKKTSTFLPSGFKDLDLLINGFYPGELIIIAGLTSIGKTSFSLALLWNIAKNLKDNEECIYCSFEMTNEQLLTRIAASELAIELSRINTRNFSDYEGQKFFYFEQYMKKNDRISFTSNSDYNLKDADDLYYEIKKKSLENFKIAALFVDYLQLMSSKLSNTKNKHEEISHITKALKKIAIEFNIPVIALSQFSRQANNKENAKPKLYHLKESGSIEQDADLVILLHKDLEKENENEIKPDDPTEVELIVAKNRNGRVGSIKLSFIKNFCKFISDEKPAN